MPELPEVESLRRGLAATVVGKRVEAVTVCWRRSFDVADTVIDALVVGHRITGIRRRGKGLIVSLDDDLQRIQVAGRGTSVCPNCQRYPVSATAATGAN